MARSDGTLDLDVLWRAYVRRFDLEHTLRFCKQSLGWTTPRVRYPEQADRWTWLVIAAYAQLHLARSWIADRRLPWERPLDGRKADTVPRPACPFRAATDGRNTSQTRQNPAVARRVALWAAAPGALPASQH